MTDKKMAADLARHIIELRMRIKVLQAVLMEYWPSGSPEPALSSWTEAEKAAAQDADFQREAFAWRRTLLEAISVETQGSALIRVLHDQFLRTGSEGGNVLEPQ
jgi:hypothetical protein